MHEYRNKLKHQATELLDRAIILDVETTGLGENDTVIEIAAACAKSRSVIIDTLVIPNSPTNPAAKAIHGIAEADALSNGVSITTAISNLLADTKLCADKPVLATYNLMFDLRMVEQSLYRETNQTTASHSARLAWLDATQGMANGVFGRPACIMELANRYFAEHLVWDANRSNFKRLSLERCLEIAGIKREGTAHRALSDVLATLDLLQHMAS